MLDPIHPLAFITTPVSPLHPPIALSLVFEVLANIDIATSPGEYSVALLLIILVLPLIGIAFLASF